MNYIPESETHYAVKVNGVLVTQPYTSKTLAEHALFNLPATQQETAQVVPVSQDGKEILLG